MNVEEHTREEIGRRIERLRDEYGAFEVHEETVENDPEFFEHGRELAREGWIGDAGAVVTDGSRVLLVRHEGAPDSWGYPGGGHEPGEHMTETASREVREETGVEVTLTDTVYARRKTIVLEDNPNERYSMLTVVFEAQYESGEVAISDDEILDAEWFETIPGNASELVERYWR